MIHGGWPYIEAAYAITLGGLAILTLVIFLCARRWAARARALDVTRRKSGA